MTTGTQYVGVMARISVAVVDINPDSSQDVQHMTRYQVTDVVQVICDQG